FQFDGEQWDYMASGSTLEVSNIRNNNDELIVAFLYGVKKFDESLEQTYNLYSYDGMGIKSNDCFYQDGMFLIADGNNGLVKTSGNWNSEFIHPSGPMSPNIFSMTAHESQVWVASGGYQSDWGNSSIKSGLYSYVDGQWSTYNKRNVPALDTISDIICIAVESGGENRVYAGSWGDGVIEFTDGEVSNVFSKHNSSLEGNVGWQSAVQISGLQFDDDMNLWVVNNGAENVLSVKKSDGEWRSFDLGSQSSGSQYNEMIIDDNNQKWIIMRHHQILVFSDNNTIDQTNDDRSRVLTSTSGNGNLPGSSAVYSIAKDQDGEIWIGTDEGVGVIYNASEMFDNVGINAQRPLVEVGGYVQYLLGSEQVTAIAIDGANRKWFGTQRAGVFLMSEDGTDQIHHFTTENSPLFSDEIFDITINDEGKVFIGTSKGIISYRSNATPPAKTNENLKVYPNPVVQGYEGPISISGLVRDASVKITDISGNLIFSTIAEGGQAIWNGENFDGRKASTGVYLVFVSNEDGSETAVGKIMIIKN
ncbi:MAG: two-component regulator propeller domain-containing protein, partial [Bacteroidota bacterium]|nr:two-component regulator propeller domain-containing protein [Bacteroidota bacterium]